MYTSCTHLGYFTTQNFNMDIKNLKKLHEALDESDKKMFGFDVETVSDPEINLTLKILRLLLMFQIDWMKLTKDGYMGVRRFILHESDETIPKAQAKLKKLYYLDRIFKVALIAVLVYFVLF